MLFDFARLRAPVIPSLGSPWPSGIAPSGVGAVHRVGVGAYRGSPDTVRKMLEYAVGPEGERSYVVRQWAESIIRKIRPKDYLSEILSIRHWTLGPWMRYTNDPSHVELVRTPQSVLEDISKYGTALVDCDDVSCLAAALGLCTGKNARFLVVGFEPQGQLTHVLLQLQEPRSGVWIACDPVAGTRDARMLRQIKRHEIHELHPSG